MAIVIFGFLIGIHEFGHFITAKLFKMNVLEFAIGMGPAIFKKQGKSTLYSVRIFPLGGYCALEGEDGDLNEEGSFNSRPVWQRVIVLMSGSLMNLFAGMVILFILFSGIDSYVTTRIAGFASDFQYTGENMLMPGDRITKINGYNIYLNADIATFLEYDSGQPYDIEVERNGEKILIRNLPLEKQMYTYIGVDENGNEVEYQELRYGLIFEADDATFFGKIKLSILNAVDFARFVKVSIFSLFSGNTNVSELMGPVGIATEITTTAQQSMSTMWMFVALIAVNLAVMNLLPIPALDGGRILFLIIGQIVLVLRGKPLNAKYEQVLNGVFLFALLGLMVYVSFNDIVRLVR